MVTTIVSAVVSLKKNIRVRQAKSCDLFLQSQVTTYLRNITCQNNFLLYCFLEKRKKTGQNTVFGYKKGSKFNLEIGSKSATPKLCMNIFTTFFPKCSQHRKPEGGGNPQNPPPAVFEVTI